MKKSLLILLSALLMLSVAGCGAGTQAEDDTFIPIVDKIYLNNSPLSEKTLDFDFLEFYDDGTFQGLDEGAGVTFGSDEFTDWTEHIKDTDPILEKFK